MEGRGGVEGVGRVEGGEEVEWREVGVKGGESERRRWEWREVGVSHLQPSVLVHRDPPTLQGRQHQNIPSGDVQTCLR